MLGAGIYDCVAPGEAGEDKIVIDGVEYAYAGFGIGGPVSYELKGDIIVITVDGTLTLKRSSGNTLTVVAIDGYVLVDFLQVGDVLTAKKRKRPSRRDGLSFWSREQRVDLHFCPGMGKNEGSHQFLNWWLQQSAGLLHLEWFDSLPLQKNNSTPVGVLFLLGAGYGSRTRLRSLGSYYNSRYTNPAWDVL